jgi:hypothetical protein
VDPQRIPQRKVGDCMGAYSTLCSGSVIMAVLTGMREHVKPPPRGLGAAGSVRRAPVRSHVNGVAVHNQRKSFEL